MRSFSSGAPPSEVYLISLFCEPAAIVLPIHTLRLLPCGAKSTNHLNGFIEAHDDSFLDQLGCNEWKLLICGNIELL